MTYDLTKVVDELTILPGKIEEAEQEVELAGYEKDMKKVFVETMFSGKFLEARAKEKPQEEAKHYANEQTHLERVDLVVHESKYKLALIKLNRLKENLMSQRQLAKLVENE